MTSHMKDMFHEGFIKLYLLSNDIELLGYNIPAKVSNIIIMHNKISDSYFYWGKWLLEVL